MSEHRFLVQRPDGTSERVRYRLGVCRNCDRGFFEVIRLRVRPRRYCDACRNSYYAKKLERAQRREQRDEQTGSDLER